MRGTTVSDAHWHAYAYTGQGFKEADVRAGKVPASFPTFVIEDFLRRSADLSEGTFTAPDPALEWLGTAYSSHPPLDAAAFPPEVRLQYARARLAQAAGRDVVVGWYSSVGRMFVSRALVLCPRPRRHWFAGDPPPCPRPPSA